MIADDYRPPHSADLRKHRFSTSCGLYFVTKCIGKPHQLSPQQRFEICDGLQLARHLRLVQLHAFVVMPDHWHALFNLGCKDDADLGRVVHRIGLWASFPSRRRREHLVWQSEFHDHHVRPGESVANIVSYIEVNPVRRQLAGLPGEWAWSSASEPWCYMLDRHFLGMERWDRNR